MSNGTFPKPLAHPPAASAYHPDKANTPKKEDSYEAASEHAQQRTLQTDDSLNASNHNVVSTGPNDEAKRVSGSASTNVSAAHPGKYVTRNNKNPTNNYNFIYIIKKIKDIVEILLPVVNIVSSYPSYAISVRSWMDYFFGSQTVEHVLGSQGVFKVILLLEKYNI